MHEKLIRFIDEIISIQIKANEGICARKGYIYSSRVFKIIHVFQHICDKLLKLGGTCGTKFDSCKVVGKNQFVGSH